jgi:hypothetical protein
LLSLYSHCSQSAFAAGVVVVAAAAAAAAGARRGCMSPLGCSVSAESARCLSIIRKNGGRRRLAICRRQPRAFSNGLSIYRELRHNRAQLDRRRYAAYVIHQPLGCVCVQSFSWTPACWQQILRRWRFRIYQPCILVATLFERIHSLLAVSIAQIYLDMFAMPASV